LGVGVGAGAGAGSGSLAHGPGLGSAVGWLRQAPSASPRAAHAVRCARAALGSRSAAGHVARRAALSELLSLSRAPPPPHGSPGYGYGGMGVLRECGGMGVWGMGVWVCGDMGIWGYGVGGWSRSRGGGRGWGGVEVGMGDGLRAASLLPLGLLRVKAARQRLDAARGVRLTLAPPPLLLEQSRLGRLGRLLRVRARVRVRVRVLGS
jgi:hypothetical protein